MSPLHFSRMLVLVLGLLVPVSISQGDKFNVHGASGPVLSLLNEDVILPCRIIPEHKPENMEITWAKADKVIHTFNEEVQSDESYSDRIEIFKEEFNHGNVSLKLKNVQVSDQAKYTCTVKSQMWYDDVIIELQVAAFGRTPVIRVFSPYEDGIKLICTSAAWYPQPKVLWIEEDGEGLENRPETSLKVCNNTGAYEVHSSVIVRSHSKSALSCIIQNTLLKQEKVSRVMLSDAFYPRVSTWMVLFIILVIIILVTGSISIWKYKELSDKLSKAAEDIKKLLNDEDIKKHVNAEGIKKLLNDEDRKKPPNGVMLPLFSWCRQSQSHADEDSKKPLNAVTKDLCALSIPYEKASGSCNISGEDGQKPLTGEDGQKPLTELRHKLSEADEDGKKSLNDEDGKKSLNDEDWMNSLNVPALWRAIESSAKTANTEIKYKKEMLETYKNELRISKCRCYRDSVTLDKNKSHQDLRISSDGKSVWHCRNTKYSEEKCSFAFSLGSTGYDKGKHYWEVDVSKGNEWVLGVTEELKVYNEIISPTESKGQWVLKSSKDEGICALEDEPTKTSENKVCDNIGIYLNCEKGELTFIDVNTWQLIHKFSTLPRASLYPFFAPNSKDGDAGKLTISTITDETIND